MQARMGWATTLILAVLAVLVVPAFVPVVQAAGAPAGPSAPTWAFGAQRWANTSVNFSGGSYSERAFFAWHIVITATNTSSTTREIEAVRTVGMTYFVQYCRPNCQHPNATGNLSVRAYQQQAAFANLTTNATVEEQANGSAMNASALGILNASDRARAGLNESYSFARGGHPLAQGSLVVLREARMALSFSPALGLVPWNATKGDSWNASATYLANGGWNDSYRYTDTFGGGTGHNASGTSSGQVSRSGTESLFGRDLGNLTLHNGANVTVVLLAFGGPFAFGDGVFLSTGAADLFGDATSDWAGHAFALGVSTLTAVDVRLDRGQHGAEFDADSGSAAMASTALGAGAVATGTGASMGPSGPAGPETAMQSQPESPQYAQSASACLVSVCSGTAPSGGLSELGLTLVAAAVATAAIIGVGIYAYRRPRGPAGPSGGSGASP